MVQPRGTGKTLARFQLVNALIWAVTILGVAVVVKASDSFTYLLLVLVAGSASSWYAIWVLLVRDSDPDVVEPAEPRSR